MQYRLAKTYARHPPNKELRRVVLLPNIMVPILLLLTMSTFLPCCTTADQSMRESDALILVDFISNSNQLGQGCIAQVNWSKQLKMSSWTGITIENNEITNISLPNAQLCGPFPPSFSILTSLTSIDLSRNKLTGQLPDFMTSLYRLKKLNLAFNSFSGTLPSSWSQMQQLSALDLSHSSAIKGSLPTSWSNLVNLNSLDVANNSLTSTLPSDWSMLTKLSALDVSTNNLNGTLPSAWSAWSVWGGQNLVSLYLANNTFTGTLPSSWRNFGELRALYINNNSITGSFPTSWNQTFWQKLGFVDLSSNLLTGEIPPFPKDGLFFNMSNNGFTGSIADIPASMVYVHMGHNRLSGAIPAINNSMLGYLNLQHNQLTSLPPMINASRLLLLSLASNSIRGTIHSSFKLPSLLFGDLSRNDLTGLVPDSWWNHTWLYLSLHHNRLQGPLPDPWPGNVEILLLQHNDISGCLPQQWNGNTSMACLSLAANPLLCKQGLPSSWASAGSFEQLALLDLQNTTARGVIPKVWLKGEAFAALKDMRMGQLWEASAKISKSWRRDVCINEKLHTKAINVTSGLPAAYLKTLQDRIQQALISGSQVGDAWRRMQEMVYPSDKWYSRTAIDLSLDDYDQASIFQAVCKNQYAQWIVLILAVSLSCIILFLVGIYTLECRFKCISALLSRTWLQSNLTSLESGKQSGTSWLWRFITVAIPCYNLFRLFLYWLDVITDLILLTYVWRKWPGHALLAVFLLHYVVSSGVLTWRLSQLGHIRTYTAAFVLLPLMPLLDTIMFLVLALKPNGWIIQVPHKPRKKDCVKTCHREVKLHLIAIDWHRLFRMRDILEVLLEAFPTAVLQSVVFVMGNDPATGWFLRPSLYIMSMVTSSWQISSLVAGVLLHARCFDIHPGAALWNMASYHPAEKGTDDTLNSLFSMLGHGWSQEVLEGDDGGLEEGVRDEQAVVMHSAMMPIIADGRFNPQYLLDLL